MIRRCSKCKCSLENIDKNAWAVRYKASIDNSLVLCDTCNGELNVLRYLIKQKMKVVDDLLTDFWIEQNVLKKQKGDSK